MKESTRRWTSFRIPGSSVPAEIDDETTSEVATLARTHSGTFIEIGAVFEGRLELTGDFRIDNEFRGELATDGTVTVGPDGCVEGNITARQVEIEGAVVGNIRARRMCILRSTGRLHGDVEAACIEIEPHAYFEGGMRMIRPIEEAASRVVQQPTL